MLWQKGFRYNPVLFVQTCGRICYAFSFLLLFHFEHSCRECLKVLNPLHLSEEKNTITYFSVNILTITTRIKYFSLRSVLCSFLYWYDWVTLLFLIWIFCCICMQQIYIFWFINSQNLFKNFIILYFLNHF